MELRPEPYAGWVNDETFTRLAALEDAAAQRNELARTAAAGVRD